MIAKPCFNCTSQVFVLNRDKRKVILCAGCKLWCCHQCGGQMSYESDETKCLQCERKSATSRRSNTLGRTAEVKASEAWGGKVVKGSGNGTDKGDFETDRFVVDNKATKHDSYRVNSLQFQTFVRLSSHQDKVPVLRVQFANGAVLCVLNESDFLEMACDRTGESVSGSANPD